MSTPKIISGQAAFLRQGQPHPPPPKPLSGQAALLHQGQPRGPAPQPVSGQAALLRRNLYSPQADTLPGTPRSPGAELPPPGETYAPWLLVPNPATGGYHFTKPVAYLLSLVSGVSLATIATVVVQRRQLGQYRPWYQSGLSGFTIGTPRLKTITYSENLFRAPAPGEEGYAYDTYNWLNLSAHEVGHLPQIDQAGGLFSYLGKFIWQYVTTFSHDGAPLEKEAEKGTEVFVAFRRFVNVRYGFGALEHLLEAPHLHDSTKISNLRSWWQVFQSTNRLLFPLAVRPWGLLILAGLLGFTSCATNEAHLDLPTQTLRPCSNTVLTSVSIDAPPPAVSYLAQWEGGSPLPGEFDFRAPAAGFRITTDGITPLPHPQFKLTSNTTYLVRTRAPNDAGDGKLVIYTGADGRIVRTGPPCQF